MTWFLDITMSAICPIRMLMARVSGLGFRVYGNYHHQRYSYVTPLLASFAAAEQRLCLSWRPGVLGAAPHTESLGQYRVFKVGLLQKKNSKKCSPSLEDLLLIQQHNAKTCRLKPKPKKKCSPQQRIPKPTNLHPYTSRDFPDAKERAHNATTLCFGCCGCCIGNLHLMENHG